MRAHGWLDDPVGSTGTHTFEELLGASYDIPESCDMSAIISGEPIMDQGITSSCVRHAMARALQICGRVHQDPNFPLPSARHITAVTKAHVESSGGVWSWNGTTGTAVTEAVQKSGFCKESDCPWEPLKDGQIYFDQGQTALDQRGIMSTRILFGSNGDLKAGIAAGYGVMIGMDVGRSWQKYTDGIWALDDEATGGHMVTLVGYKPGAFLGVNSYGPEWGIKGYFWVSEDYVADEYRVRSKWIVKFVPTYSR